MKLTADPVGPENDAWLRYYVERSSQVVFCWGNDGKHLNRDQHVAAMFSNAQCFGITQKKQPVHPLYLSKDTVLKSFQIRAV